MCVIISSLAAFSSVVVMLIVMMRIKRTKEMLANLIMGRRRGLTIKTIRIGSRSPKSMTSETMRTEMPTN